MNTTVGSLFRSSVANYLESKNKKLKLIYGLNSLLILTEYLLYIFSFFALERFKINDFKDKNYVYLICVLLLTNGFMFIRAKLFSIPVKYSMLEELFQITKLIFFSFLMVLGLLFLLKTTIIYSRTVIILYFFCIIFIAISIRIVKRFAMIVLSQKGILKTNVLIVGAGKIGSNYRQWLNDAENKYLNFVGFVDDFKKDKGVLGNLDDIEKIIRLYDIDEIIITIPSEKNSIYKLIKKISKYRLRVKIIPELYNLISTKFSFDEIDSFPFMEVNEQPYILYKFLKRFVDIILSLFAIVFLSPVFLSLYTLIKRTSDGPAIFTQNRIGQNGMPFKIIKFRTMVTNAQEILENDKDLYAKYIENNYKLDPDEDPRITKIGRFLRKTSLDELPQFFNVFKGDMSLIGPRPVIEKELFEYKDSCEDFLSVKPGITGYWQVSGRSDIGYPERVDIELYYVYNQSFTLDIKILLKTIVTVIKKQGAY